MGTGGFFLANSRRKTCYSKIAFDCPAKPGRDFSRVCPLSNTEEIQVKKIFVGNLDFNATEDAIRSLFEQHGAVDRVSVITDRDTGRSRGFAFVEMPDAAEAERAIAALNGYTLDGRALNVNEARPKMEGGGRSGGGNVRGGRGSGPRQRREPRW
jgi:cold-inducible RNA-binding protein